LFVYVRFDHTPLCEFEFMFQTSGRMFQAPGRMFEISGRMFRYSAGC